MGKDVQLLNVDTDQYKVGAVILDASGKQLGEVVEVLPQADAIRIRLRDDVTLEDFKAYVEAQ